MPLINVEYDDNKISDSEIKILSEGIKKVVSEVTGIGDVFVYANSAKVKVNIAPVEVFIKMSAEKITDQDKLLAEIKSKLIDFKSKNSFSHLINLTLIPMHWKVEIGI